ncbi:hypothetical protein [Streptomyces sp. V4I2]|uniref:hypothetical protein n=1 Tax=Streptomyces sp. V4I2 TaxID=3042280 RepID=UPI002788E525|nr:hypothetical protein [Streptomyces sp. V4I2]MDQ1042154.1 hypothetical protein [Streptomyces sp. V4I2]
MTHTNTTQPARRKPRRQKGRPSLLTPAVMDLLTRATAAGLPMKQAADASVSSTPGVASSPPGVAA